MTLLNSGDGEIIAVNKPLFWSSFDVVNYFKRQVKPLKIGHAGTLDPMASGLLILCTGKKTKTIDQIQALSKEYTGTIKLGATTAGHDLEAIEEEQYIGDEIMLIDIIEKASLFIGRINQTPPVYSAVKIDGKRAYEYGRNGLQLEIKSKEVTIYEFELTNYLWPKIDFRVVCSKGTYIRSLAHDLGHSLGCGGYLTQLIRTKIGDYDLSFAKQDLIGQTTAKSRILREKVAAAHPELIFD